MSNLSQHLEGELLGDASLLVPKRGVNAVFQLQTKYKGQAHFAFASLHVLGGDIYPFIRKPSGFNTKPSQMYHWRSCAASWLTEEWRRWYIDGTKIVPRDFVLTPTSALHWYIGDGSLNKHNPRIILCADSFDEVSLARLLQQLHVNGFSPRKRWSSKNNPRIELGVGDVANWLNWIGPCPVLELQHKWTPNFRTKHNRHVAPDERAHIRALHTDGMNYPEISREVGRSYHTVYSIIRGRKSR